MRNTADVTGGKPIAVLLQSILGASAINLVKNISSALELFFEPIRIKRMLSSSMVCIFNKKAILM
jgi:hypothetical protein